MKPSTFLRPLLWVAMTFGPTLSAQGLETKPIPPGAARVRPAVELVRTRIKAESEWLVFSLEVRGKAGDIRVTRSGKMGGDAVLSYVWPTSLDPAEVGFEKGSGILAFAVTAHPTFDDTPLFDENRDGDLANDGYMWHSHWVVLGKDGACPGGLKVMGIPEGASPKVPLTWPGVPLLLDSPGYTPVLKGHTLTVRVPFRHAGALKGTSFDGVTAGLRLNANIHDPKLCVVDVFHVASGDLSLPGRVE